MTELKYQIDIHLKGQRSLRLKLGHVRWKLSAEPHVPVRRVRPAQGCTQSGRRGDTRQQVPDHQGRPLARSVKGQSLDTAWQHGTNQETSGLASLRSAHPREGGTPARNAPRTDPPAPSCELRRAACKALPQTPVRAALTGTRWGVPGSVCRMSPRPQGNSLGWGKSGVDLSLLRSIRQMPWELPNADAGAPDNSSRVSSRQPGFSATHHPPVSGLDGRTQSSRQLAS